MAEDIMIGMDTACPRSGSREDFLYEFSETTRHVLGGRLTFKPTQPFTNTLPGRDNEILPAGTLITAETKGILRNKPMDLRLLYDCMACGLKKMRVPVSALGLQRTQEGVWIGPETVDLLQKSLHEFDSGPRYPSTLLAREVFAQGFLAPQGKQVSR